MHHAQPKKTIGLWVVWIQRQRSPKLSDCALPILLDIWRGYQRLAEPTVGLGRIRIQSEHMAERCLGASVVSHLSVEQTALIPRVGLVRVDRYHCLNLYLRGRVSALARVVNRIHQKIFL